MENDVSNKPGSDLRVQLGKLKYSDLFALNDGVPQKQKSDFKLTFWYEYIYIYMFLFEGGQARRANQRP